MYGTLEQFKARIVALNNHGIVTNSAEEALATEALTDSMNIINRVLVGRGLSLAQIATWIEVDMFAIDIAIYLYGVRQGWEKRNAEEINWLKRYDRMKELETVVIILSDGTIVQDANSNSIPAMSSFNLNDNDR